MQVILSVIDFILHIDKHLVAIVDQYKVWSYAILFIIVFCETGLVVTPFLPGDSLLFAAGAVASKGVIDPNFLALILFIAAVVGDAVNYSIGRYIGPKVFEKKDSRIFKQEYLRRTQRFFEKYGSKTIVFARFVPIVRTFAPFLAGVGSMSYSKFGLYNVFGGALWVGIFVYAGFFFGSQPFVEKNFKVVILAIIVLSFLPAVIEVIKARREARREAQNGACA
jgi:membrane-associated protein